MREAKNNRKFPEPSVSGRCHTSNHVLRSVNVVTTCLSRTRKMIMRAGDVVLLQKWHLTSPVEIFLPRPKERPDLVPSSAGCSGNCGRTSSRTTHNCCGCDIQVVFIPCCCCCLLFFFPFFFLSWPMPPPPPLLCFVPVLSSMLLVGSSMTASASGPSRCSEEGRENKYWHPKMCMGSLRRVGRSTSLLDPGR